MFTSSTQVPAVTFDTVAAVLAARPAGTNVRADTILVTLRFNGVTTLPSGVEVQVLEETAVAPPGGWSSDMSWSSGVTWFPIAPPWGEVARARTGRRDALSLAGQFLHGGMWRRTSRWIGTHEADDTDTLPDWKFLEADLIPGRTFELALLPGLADDVRLHGRIVRSLTVETPRGPIAGGIEVHYFVDYGLSEFTDPEGRPLGVGRQFSCGSVLYAPGVGPVRGDERGLHFAGTSLRTGNGDRMLDLVGTSLISASSR